MNVNYARLHLAEPHLLSGPPTPGRSVYPGAWRERGEERSFGVLKGESTNLDGTHVITR